MIWTDDPVRDADRYAEAVAEWEEGFPICSECGEHIVEGEEYYEISTDELYHAECFEREFKRYMRDWRAL